MTTFAEFISKPDLDKLYLIEIKVAKEIEGNTWNATGGGSWWSTHGDGEVVVLKEDGAALTEQANVAACDAAAGSWFYDHDNRRIYVHPTDSDIPSTLDGAAYKYVIMAYMWWGFTNDSTDEVVYKIQGGDEDVAYLPYLSDRRMPSIYQAVGDYYVGDIRMSFGTIGFNNDGWWYGALENYNWHNKDFVLKIGAKGSDYADFEPIFTGKVRNPRVGDKEALLDVNDVRIASLRTIPEDRYDTTTYPNLETRADGLVIPILFGPEENITPVCVDTTTFKYKIAGHALEAITAVYQNGTLITGGGVDYTADLPNGEFTLVADPDNDVITCDAQGVKCGYNHPGDVASGLYSYLVSDILIYLLNTLNAVPLASIDTGAGSSFLDLQTSRTQTISLYLNNPQTTWEVIRTLQKSGVFHLIPMLDGTYEAHRYQTGTPAGSPYIYSEDYKKFQGIDYKTDETIKKVVVEYDRDPSTEEYLSVSTIAIKVGYRYDEEAALTVRTALSIKAEAQALADLYSDLVKVPAKRITITIPAIALDRRPAEKLVLNREVVGADGQGIAIFTDEVYRILSLRKYLDTADVEVGLLQDLQSTGDYYTDVAHVDSHTDSHSDAAHADVDAEHVHHGDVVHTDVPYSDVPHADSEHADVPHEDIPHEDYHVDEHGDHEDDGHSDSHDDEVHEDSPHTDVPHEDEEHGDSHTDDPHEDIPHEDVEHEDVEHEDSDHADSHSDSYSDVPHSDFEY